MYSAEDLYTEEQDDLEIIQEPEYTENVQEDNEENEQQTDNNGETASGTKETKAKRIIRNPQPKLNAETLKSAKGLQALPALFENIKFKGKGHEEEDLNLLMKTYEYWCHRLFPKLPLDDCLLKIETLGHKKPVQTYLKKIRMDLLLDETQQVQENSENEDEVLNATSTDPFDEIVPLAVEEPVELTEEQLERIRLNKERALRIRREKMQMIRNAAEPHLPTTEGQGTQGLVKTAETYQPTYMEVSQDDLSDILQHNEEIVKEHQTTTATEEEENENKAHRSDSEDNQNKSVSSSSEKTKLKRNKRRLIESSDEEFENDISEQQNGVLNSTQNNKNETNIEADRDVNIALIDLSDDDLIQNVAEHEVTNTFNTNSLVVDNTKITSECGNITDKSQAETNELQTCLDEEVDIDGILNQIEENI